MEDGGARILPPRAQSLALRPAPALPSPLSPHPTLARPACWTLPRLTVGSRPALAPSGGAAGKVNFAIDRERERYPFCVVWTPLPLITWCASPCPCCCGRRCHSTAAAAACLLPAAERGPRAAQDLPGDRPHRDHQLRWYPSTLAHSPAPVLRLRGSGGADGQTAG